MFLIFGDDLKINSEGKIYRKIEDIDVLTGFPKVKNAKVSHIKPIHAIDRYLIIFELEDKRYSFIQKA